MNTQTHDAASDCDAILELVADYAFGLTSVDESRLVEAGLPGCPEAAAQLDDYRRLQDAMRVDVPQIDPPSGLSDRIMAAAFGAPAAQRTVSFPAGRGWLAAAAAVALLVLTNVYWLSRVSSEPLPDQVTTFITNGQDIRWAKLPAEDAESPAATYIMWNAGGDTGMMYAEHLPVLDPGLVYQLWLTRDGVRTPVSSFVVDDEGEAAVLFKADQPVGAFDWAWVTIEPEGGSEQPSDAVVTGGEL